MSDRLRWNRVSEVSSSRVPATCRITGCTAKTATGEGLCSRHAADQERRRRAAVVASGLGRTLVAYDPDPSWRSRAACKGLDPGLFFPEIGETAAEAKTVCAGCPVIRQCLGFALANAESEGIWGGTTPRGRRRLRRELLREAS